MMAKRRKKPPRMWIYSPPRLPKPKVPDDLKAEVTERAGQLIEELKKLHIKKPPKGYKWNYIVDLSTKWFRSYFYFCAKYACPGPNAISPFFERTVCSYGVCWQQAIQFIVYEAYGRMDRIGAGLDSK